MKISRRDAVIIVAGFLLAYYVCSVSSLADSCAPAPGPRADRDVPRFINVANETQLINRITEGNFCYRSGKPSVSNAFCSALWAADNVLKLASAAALAAEMLEGSTRLVLLNKDVSQKLQAVVASDNDAKLWRFQALGLTSSSEVTLAGAEIRSGKAWQLSHEVYLVSKNRQVQIEMESVYGAALFFK